MKKNSLNALFFARVGPKKYENFLTLMQKTLGLLDSYPDIPGFCVHWNFPSYPLFEDRSPRGAAITQAIMERVNGGKDLFIPQGYAGLFHKYLMPDELQSELGWSIENPWKSGAADIFMDKPTALMPLDADLFRFSVKMLYGNLGIPIILPPSKGNAACSESETLLIFQEEQTSRLPLLYLNGTNQDAYASLKRKLNRTSVPIAIFTDIETLKDLEVMDGFLASVSKLLNKNADIFFFGLAECFNSLIAFEPNLSEEQNSIPFASLEGGHPSVSGIDYPVCRCFNADDRFFLQELADARSNKESVHTAFAREGLRKLLISGSSIHKQNSPSQDKKPPTGYAPSKRSISANMPGSASLCEPGFEATFFEGRLNNIILQGKPLLANLPANSFIGRERFKPVHDINAFAFDEDDIRGMREILQIKPPSSKKPGELTIDYYLVEDYPILVVDVFVSYPVFETNSLIDGYGNFELPLFILSGMERVGITASYPDDEEYSVSMGAEDPACTINGVGFTFSKWSGGIEKENREDSFTIRCFSGSVPFIFSMGIKAAKMDKKHSILTINPFGSYDSVPTTAINGLEEHFNLVLSLTNAAEKIDLALPDKIAGFLKPYWAFKRL